MRAAAPFLLLSLHTLAQRACHSYQGDLGDGANIGCFPSQTPADCAALCLNTTACGAFTFTVAGSAACYLHPSAGRHVNSASPYISGICIDDEASFGDVLALSDASGASGVPLIVAARQP